MKRKSCPFCGSTLLSVEQLYPAWGGSVKETHVVCDECACSAPVYIWDNDTPANTAEHKPVNVVAITTQNRTS
jgi:C4-type Zn-finger protein